MNFGRRTSGTHRNNADCLAESERLQTNSWVALLPETNATAHDGPRHPNSSYVVLCGIPWTYSLLDHMFREQTLSLPENNLLYTTLYHTHQASMACFFDAGIIVASRCKRHPHEDALRCTIHRLLNGKAAGATSHLWTEKGHLRITPHTYYHPCT